MNCEILSVGSEILLGTTVNTDASDISLLLAEIGVNVYWHTVVGDNPGRLKEAVSIARSRADLIITTGGLGPTCDDLTKVVLAESFGLSMEYHPEEAEYIENRVRNSGHNMTENNLQQAYLPSGCTVFHNDWGTAPGCSFSVDNTTVIMLPGPPRECNSLFRHVAMPWLQNFLKKEETIVSHTVQVFGMGESAIEQLLRPRMLELSNPTLAPYAKEGEAMLRVTAKARTKEEADNLCQPILEEIKSLLGDVIYSIDGTSLEALCLSLLEQNGQTLAVAESCTGGLLSKRITDVPGASRTFLGGGITYAISAKETLALVPHEIIEEYTVNSEDVAFAMACGIRENLSADFGIGITGVAGPGPDGDTPEGTIFVALSTPTGDFCRKLTGGIGRTPNRTKAASSALDMLRRYLQGLPVF